MALKKIYLAIPYSGMHTSSYEQSLEATTLLIKGGGLNVYSPIVHSHPLHMAGLEGDWNTWQAIDLQYIDWADEVYVLVPKEGLLKVILSTGVTAEVKYARSLEKPVHFIKVESGAVQNYELKPST